MIEVAKLKKLTDPLQNDVPAALSSFSSLRPAVDGEIEIVGAMQDVSTGGMTFVDADGEAKRIAA